MQARPNDKMVRRRVDESLAMTSRTLIAPTVYVYDVGQISNNERNEIHEGTKYRTRTLTESLCDPIL